MIGIVVVSHSHALAEAAIALAGEMVPAERRPRIEAAAGLDAHTFGTDATAIAAAVGSVDDGDGVLVLLDLGSAILSAEMALEFLDPDAAARVRLSPAPLVEGLVAAVVKASTGAGLDACDAEAQRGLEAKASHLGDGAAVSAPSERAASDEAGEWLVVEIPVELSSGLHARPAAAVVAALGDLDCEVLARNATLVGEETQADSAIGLMGLGLREGDVLAVRASGPDASAAIAALEALAADRFGER